MGLSTTLAVGCSLITPLDFVGNPPSEPSAESGVPDAGAGGREGDAAPDIANPDSSPGGAAGAGGNENDAAAGAGGSGEGGSVIDASPVDAIIDDTSVEDTSVDGTGVEDGPEDTSPADHIVKDSPIDTPIDSPVDIYVPPLTPCEGRCSSPESLIDSGGGLRPASSTLGTSERCFEAYNYKPANPRIVCWNFADEPRRTLQVNGQLVPCVNGNGTPLSAEPSGMYCVQVGEGNWNEAGFVLAW
jgi:hypothetical protein